MAESLESIVCHIDIAGVDEEEIWGLRDGGRITEKSPHGNYTVGNSGCTQRKYMIPE